MRPRRAAWAGPMAVAALVLAFTWRLVFTTGILARGDTFLYFYPYWDYRNAALLAGRLPLWEPLLFMGAPFLANSQAGVLYPLNWPLAGLDAPTGVKAALVAHLAIMALGTYGFARRAAGQSRLAALTAAVLFALGGYVTAQMEHVNQLQGLAWLPWLMLAAHTLMGARGRGLIVPAAGVAMPAALQLLAGHTQTVFISLTGAGLYALGLALPEAWARRRKQAGGSYGGLARVALLGAAAAGAALLGAAQVLPTLELAGQSLRGGGLPLREALSFSLDPRLLARALLPGYSRALFSEFVAYSGVAGLALAVLGLGRARGRMALAGVALVGGLFALGAYDPLYLGLAALPPFNLFRVPARWLALTAWGVALLAGYGLDALAAPRSRRRWAAALAVPLGLAALTPLAATLTPAGETGPLGLPQWRDLAGWLLPLAALAMLAALPARWAWRRSAVAALAAVELFVAAQGLPFNQLTTPEAYSSVRPALTQLLAAKAAAGPNRPPGRFLSMSALRFDPGDAAELRSAFAGQLSEAALYDFIVATKQQEVVSPNLPLTWGVPAVDGYDGGVLPLRHYADFTTLFTGAASADGRLRENVTSAPDTRLLALVNGRYLITDKVNDAWRDGVFYDLQFTLTLGAGQEAQIAYVPRFTATAVGVVAEAYGGWLTVTTAKGEAVTVPLNGSRVAWPGPLAPVTLTLTGPLTLNGLSLIDERSGAFQTLTLGPYRLVHSGDVKVYEHQGVLPRAFVAARAETADDQTALARLADPAFDAAGTVLLADAGAGEQPPSAPPRPATFTHYAPERVVVEAEGPGYLVVTDAYYPGWEATVDGRPTPILRADVMFRAVALTAGTHTVVFSYAPRSVTVGLWVSGTAWLGLGGMLLAAAWGSRRD
ncbi:MAG: YfhO family protein [Anaerolineales bacterium]|nr:YfhO family protein [Anaerolineales bacterium]